MHEHKGNFLLRSRLYLLANNRNSSLKDSDISLNVTPFTLGGLPADELSQGMIRSLREIADENGWTIEEVMTMAAEYYAARRQTEKELAAKIVESPDPIPGLS
jgi:hypothetical protein